MLNPKWNILNSCLFILNRSSPRIGEKNLPCFFQICILFLQKPLRIASYPFIVDLLHGIYADQLQFTLCVSLAEEKPVPYGTANQQIPLHLDQGPNKYRQA